MADSSHCVVDVDSAQFYKHGQRIGGDVFLSSRNEQKDRIVCTLSDGLGSGVKANVLASLTANMAQKLSFSPLQVTRSAQIIMDTLPVCRERKISYATFSIAQLHLERSGTAGLRVIEYDNPSCLLFHKSKYVSVDRRKIGLGTNRSGRQEQISYVELEMEADWRLVMLTDGVTQAGIGTKAFALGWRREQVKQFISALLTRKPDINSRELSLAVIRKARQLDAGVPGDDITCAAVTVRKPRDLIIATGPPYVKEHDNELVERVMGFQGMKIVSGGTTAQIFSRILSRRVHIDLKHWDREIPPCSRMEGLDLVTEGMLTLNRAAVELDRGLPVEQITSASVRTFVGMILASDRIHFLVGTKINDAHQDPNVPVEIGIRRTIVHRIREALEHKYMKETSVSFL
jgi:hypothetical protein